MITITTEFLDSNWKVLRETSILPVQLSEWDDGDAYTQSDIGVLPSRKVVHGAIVMGDMSVSDFSIVIRLRRSTNEEKEMMYNSPDGHQYQAVAEQYIDGMNKSISVCIENVANTLSSRRRGLIETDDLKDSSVLVVGLGTGGIIITLELAKAGVGKFILIDSDRLETGNVSRHSAGISLVGRKKVAAAKDLILETNPFAEVEIHSVKANEETEELTKNAVLRCDLIICGTDNRPSKLFLNTLCVNVEKCVIFAGARRRAFAGEVLRVRPSESACYHCYVLNKPDEEADREISSQEDADSIAYSDMPVAIEPGLSIDIAPIALMVAKLALQELLIGKKSTLQMLNEDFKANLYKWGNRPEPDTEYALCPPLSDSIDEITILRWYGIYLDKEAGCPTCGDFESAMREEYGIDGGMGILPFNPDILQQEDK